MLTKNFKKIVFYLVQGNFPKEITIKEPPMGQLFGSVNYFNKNLSDSSRPKISTARLNLSITPEKLAGECASLPI